MIWEIKLFNILILFFNKIFLKVFGFPIPEKIKYFFEVLNSFKFLILKLVMKILILLLIFFTALVIFLISPLLSFISTQSYFDKLFNFSLNGPAGIKKPLPIVFIESKHTICKS